MGEPLWLGVESDLVLLHAQNHPICNAANNSFANGGSHMFALAYMKKRMFSPAQYVSSSASSSSSVYLLLCIDRAPANGKVKYLADM